MDNLTHSLLGATFAELALPAGAGKPQRRLFFAAGIIASNLPDADLLYARITPAPLGYLLHHRGHTHTLVGLVGQALLIALVCLAPGIRRLIAPSPERFWGLIAAALLSHVVLDSWNSYGVHPFYPFDNRWYYGDAIFIFEPWLWVFLGVAAVANANNRYTGAGVAALVVAILGVLDRAGMISSGALAATVAGGIVLALAVRHQTPRAKSSAALAATAIFVAGMFGLERVARGEVLASLQPDVRANIVDIVLSSNPANPLSWSALTVERNERSGEFVLRQGALSLGGAPVWAREIHQSLARLRELNRANCWARAWLQFGRAPVLGDGDIADLRYGPPSRANFTELSFGPRGQPNACPQHLTNWRMPRADLLSGAP